MKIIRMRIEFPASSTPSEFRLPRPRVSQLADGRLVADHKGDLPVGVKVSYELIDK